MNRMIDPTQAKIMIVNDIGPNSRANAASQHRVGALRAEPLRVSGKAARRISQGEEQ